MCGRFNVDADPLSRLLMELVKLRHPGPDNHNAAPTESTNTHDHRTHRDHTQVHTHK